MMYKHTRRSRVVGNHRIVYGKVLVVESIHLKIKLSADECSYYFIYTSSAVLVFITYDWFIQVTLSVLGKH